MVLSCLIFRTIYLNVSEASIACNQCSVLFMRNKSSNKPFNWAIPKMSWETETQCDEFTQHIPKFSWESETETYSYHTNRNYDDRCGFIGNDDTQVSNDPVIGVNKSNIETYNFYLPKHSWESEYNCAEFSHLNPNYSLGKEKLSNEDYGNSKCDGGYGFFNYDFAQRPASPDPNIDIDQVLQTLCDVQQPSALEDKFDSTRKYNSPEYTIFDDAQRPESPNLILDEDAIRRLLCDSSQDFSGSKRCWGKQHRRGG